jgi:acetyl esterase
VTGPATTGPTATATAVELDEAAVDLILDGGWAPAPVHPDVLAVTARFEAAGVRPHHELGVLRAREVLEAVTRLQGDPAPVAAVRDLLVPGADGRLPARLYLPRAGDRPADRPLVIYLHGGGWVLGGVETADRPCRRLALAGDAAVVSVGYRRAPETPFPGPLADCVAAVEWLLAHAGELGGAPGRVVLVGDSAGGNLVAATSAALRDAGIPAPAHQILVYPCLHPAEGSPFASYREQAHGPLMTRAEMAWFWELYAPGTADGRAAPLLAEHLAGLPPTTVVVAERDLLRDEALAYVRRLRAAGVPTATTLYRGAAHGFWWMDAAMSQAAELTDQLGALIRAVPRAEVEA